MRHPARVNAQKRGRRAETLAVLLLRFKGYRILARRLKTPVGEIDILAKKRGALVAVEVKARSTLDLAAESIGKRQWERIARALQWRLSHRPNETALAARFDAVLIAGWKTKHIKDAWRPSF